MVKKQMLKKDKPSLSFEKQQEKAQQHRARFLALALSAFIFLIFIGTIAKRLQ